MNEQDFRTFANFIGSRARAKQIVGSPEMPDLDDDSTDDADDDGPINTFSEESLVWGHLGRALECERGSALARGHLRAARKCIDDHLRGKSDDGNGVSGPELFSSGPARIVFRK